MAPTRWHLMLLPLLVTTASGFALTKGNSFTRESVLVNGGASGYATTLEGKKEKVDRVKELLETSQMIFSVPGSSLTVGQVGALRRSLPEGTTMSTVKNKLMKRAIEGTEYEPAADIMKGENMWFFIEEDIGGTIKAFGSFAKEDGLGDTHQPKYGVIDGQVVDAAGIDRIKSLPSKKELIGKIASGINMVPLKLARVIKAPNEKLARAIKLATSEEEAD